MDYFTRHVIIPYNLDFKLKPERMGDGGINNISISDLEEELNSCFIAIDYWLKEELIKYIKDYLLQVRFDIGNTKRRIKAKKISLKKLEKEHLNLDPNNDNDFEILKKITNLNTQVSVEEIIMDYLFEQKTFIRDWTKEKRQELLKIKKKKSKEEEKRINKLLDELSPENDGTNLHPQIFKRTETYNNFKNYTENFIVDEYTDYSYLFQRLKKGSFIFHIKHLDFMDWLLKNEFISEKVFNKFTSEGFFKSLNKSYSAQRDNNFNNQFQ